MPESDSRVATSRRLAIWRRRRFWYMLGRQAVFRGEGPLEGADRESRGPREFAFPTGRSRRVIIAMDHAEADVVPAFDLGGIEGTGDADGADRPAPCADHGQFRRHAPGGGVVVASDALEPLAHDPPRENRSSPSRKWAAR